MSRPRGPRNRSKAEVRFEQRAGRSVVVKDFGASPWWVRRLVGRPALRRELRAYRRLEGVAGVPACVGLEGPDTLVLERAPGESLSALEVGSVGAATFDELERVLREVHARGVAITDLHRSNVLVGPAGGVHVVDLALALLARDAARPGLLVRLLMRLDRFAAARMRARYLGLPEPEPEGVLRPLYRAGRALKRALPRPAE
ncbi:MAG: hypothetical protein KBD01_09650 [Acidobacteria bacterium]|nr:hypothetical protein [Acidobacteriota bacterium]